MHPAQVLDFQADLKARFDNPAMLAYVKSHFTIDHRTHLMGMGLTDEQAMREAEAQVPGLMEGHRVALQVGSAYYVDPDMTELITWAAAGMDASDVFRRDVLPTVAGFAYFDNPWIIHDVRGVDLKVNAVLWHPTRTRDMATGIERTGIVMLMLNDQDHTPDDIALSLLADMKTRGAYDIYRATMGRWGVIGWEIVVDGTAVGPETIELTTYKRDELLGEGIMPSDFTNSRRIMLAFWLMLGQTITDVSESEIPRAFARRARRMGIPDRVSIIRLRRRVMEERGVGEVAVEWSHRWYSRGHWRWQPVSEHHPLAEPDGSGGWKARLWVRESIKGPADKPLIITEKVAWLRD